MREEEEEEEPSQKLETKNTIQFFRFSQPHYYIVTFSLSEERRLFFLSIFISDVGLPWPSLASSGWLIMFCVC